MLSSQLKDMLMRVYDMRPSTAESVMRIAEIIGDIEKSEYMRGYFSGDEAVKMNEAKWSEKVVGESK